MTISDEGLSLIKQFEGCVLKVYLDPVGIKTAGVGHTGADVNAMAAGTKITQAQADAWLRSDVKKAEANVASFDHIYHWTQNQYDALVSFAFNCGSINQLCSNGKRSIAEISAKITAYNKAGGKVLAGLTRRRKAEKALFDRASDKQTATAEKRQETNVEAYTKGGTYTLACNLYVRDAAAGNKKKYSALSADGKAHGYADAQGNAILKAGTKVTVKDKKAVGADTWLQIPSGWIAARVSGKVYVK